MPLDPVKIPANIQVEEKIIGPIGLRQIMILLISGGLSYVVWGSMIQYMGGVSIVTGFISLIPLMIGIAFSFVKVNDVSLLSLCFLWFERQKKPNTRSFGPRAGITINIRTNIETKKKQTQSAKDIAPEDTLAHLSDLLDGNIEAFSTDAGPQGAMDIAHPADEPLPDASEPRPAVNPQRVQTAPLNNPASVDGLVAGDSDDAPAPQPPMMRDLMPPATA